MLIANKKLISIVIFICAFFNYVAYSQSISDYTYIPTDEIFFNPERGFYAYSQDPITASFITSIKTQNISVIQQNYIIPQFRNKSLSSDFLSSIEKDLDTARRGGVKLILRFFYTDFQDGEDAALDTILLHISQIEPILQENYDVIVLMDAGFIGAWGEWYYSTHNLNNTEDRRTVLFALLDALPTERTVVIRTPNYKRKIFNYDLPLTAQEAFDGSKRARIGADNDCFLADKTDAGTYLWNDIEGDKNYLNQDNRFVPQHGETCSPSAYSGCANALTDLERMHWSIINKDYNLDVLNGWETGGCMDEIKRRLGYRLSLLNASIVDSVKPEGVFSMNFKLVNEGFASPFNPRLLEVILRNTLTLQTYRLVTDSDPRFWLSGDTVSVDLLGGIPADMPQGAYDVFLHLADPAPKLRDRPDYAIRLANQNVWEASTGYNSLLHQVEINAAASGENYSGEHFFEFFVADSQPPVPQTSIILDGKFDDWQNVPQLDVYPDEEFSGDAPSADLDLVDVWATNDDENIYLSYKLNADLNSAYFYHVFFDTDNNPSSGFHSDGSYSGIDYMVENDKLWQYSGTNGEWAWTNAGAIGFAQGKNDQSRVELAVPRSLLEAGGMNEHLTLFFNVDDGLSNTESDYVPNGYKTHSFVYQIAPTAIGHFTIQNIPEKLSVNSYPNPFNNQVVISVHSANQITEAAIFDIQGRKVKTIEGQELHNKRFFWDGKTDSGKECASGLYMIKVSDGRTFRATRIILLK